MKLVFLGAPGAGKGTQARIFSRKYNVPQLSTGDVLRRAVASGSSLGVQAKAIMNTGQLVSDEIVNRIVAERLDEKDCLDGFILDGYPRTLMQAKVLQDILFSKKIALDAVIELTVDEAVLTERMKQRVADSIAAGNDVRSDDNLEVFSSRLAEYHEKTSPLSQYYAATGQLRVVDGMGEVGAVTVEIDKILKDFLHVNSG